MKPSASRIERILTKVEARLVPPPRKWLQVVIHEGDAPMKPSASRIERILTKVARFSN
jgi:hypothetical protein